MPISRRIQVQTYMHYDGTNAAECTAWLNQHGVMMVEDAPNGWVLVRTDQNGTLHYDCPGGNGGGGFPMPWPVGGYSLLSGGLASFPSDAESVESLTIVAPE